MFSDKKVIKFIATGLVEWQNQYEHKGSYYPMSDTLSRGVTMLVSKCMGMGVPYPQDTAEIISFMSKPIATWEIFEDVFFDEEEVFIEYGQLTDWCYEYYVNSKNVEDELSQRLILSVLDKCRAEEDQQGYVNFRKMIIEHPIIPVNEMMSWSSDPLNSTASSYLKEFYESIPQYAIKEGAVYKCQYCGWTIEWDKSGNPSCHSTLCREFTNNFRNIVKVKESPTSLVRLKRGCMRFISKPGKYEINLEKRLTSMGLKIEMWPQFDKYDLRVTFPSGTVWAIDVKDYSNPYQLMENLGEFPECCYDAAFFVVPQYRYKRDKSYEAIFKNLYNHKLNVQLLMEKNLIKKVKLKLGGDF